MRLVIKLAGALLDDPETVASIARQVVALAQEGHELLVVHGGGKIFTATLQRMGIESKFVAGLRVTDRETRDVAVMVMGGLLNKRVAGAITQAGQPAIGLCASDAATFLAEPMTYNDTTSELILFIKPTIIESSSAANLISQETVSKSLASKSVADYLETGVVNPPPDDAPPPPAPIKTTANPQRP